METSKARIPYLDFLKFFAIGSVLLGHSVEQLTGNDYWDNPIWSFIYTYHMPLFMLLCGYFFGSSLKLTFGELLKKKFVQLLLPSVTAFVIVWTAVSVMGHNPWPALFTPDWMGFMNTVWFLKCVFVLFGGILVHPLVPECLAGSPRDCRVVRHFALWRRGELQLYASHVLGGICL